MKKKDIVDLIMAHYDNNSREFFNITFRILKEFKEAGDDAIVDRLSMFLKPRVKIAPKYEADAYVPEIALDDAFVFVPQEESNE